MEVDNEVLIALVFDRQAIWDKRHKFHGNRNVTEKCWKEISLEMKQDENKLRKRWRYLRDQFTVELGKLPPPRSGDDSTSGPKWPYFKPLLFLKPVVKARATTGSLTRRRSASSPSTSNTEDVSEQSSVPSVMYTSKRSFSQEKEKSRPNQADADNEHLLFFKSLLPHIDRIPQHMLLSFRSRVQSVVDEFAYQY